MEITNEDPCHANLHVMESNQMPLPGTWISTLYFLFFISRKKVQRIHIPLFSCVIPNLYPSIEDKQAMKVSQVFIMKQYLWFLNFFAFQGGKIMPCSCNRIFPHHLNIACDISSHAPLSLSSYLYSLSITCLKSFLITDLCTVETKASTPVIKMFKRTYLQTWFKIQWKLKLSFWCCSVVVLLYFSWNKKMNLRVCWSCYMFHQQIRSYRCHISGSNDKIHWVIFHIFTLTMTL